MTCSYLVLGCAVLCEVLWAVMLRLSNGFSVLWASVVMVVAYAGSLLCLSIACKGLTVALAYAIWSGLGGTLIALVSTFAFKDRLGVGGGLGVALVISGVALLLAFGPRAAQGR